MSDANRVQLAYVEESAFGAQETGSALQILRYNNESLSHDMATVVSEELRSDRQISDIVRVGLSASGDITFELSYGSHDTLLKSALLSSGWSTERKVTNSVSISASSVDNSFNDAGSGFGNFSAHQWIYVTGFANAANNGFFKLASATAAKLTVSTGTLVTEAASENITVQMGSQITNGTTLDSYNFEKDFKDLSNVLALFKGMCINSLTLNIPADGIITGGFGFIGSAEEALTATGGSEYTAVTTTKVMTGANHVPEILENLSDIAILDLSLSLNNNLRTRMQVGTLGVASIGVGSIDLTGSLTLNLANATLYNKFLNQTVTSIALAVRDTVGNGYVIELPAVKITSGKRSAGGINTDVIGEFEFKAYMDSTESITIRIARFPIAAYLESYCNATATVVGALTVA